MATSRADPKSTAAGGPRQQSQRARTLRDRAPAGMGLHDPQSIPERGDNQLYVLESDLSGDRGADDQELRAIERLLDDELEGILSGRQLS
jgi:hypothetical protein